MTLVEEVIENKEIKPFENVLEFVTGGGDKENKKVDSESEKKSDEQNEGVVLNEEIIKEELCIVYDLSAKETLTSKTKQKSIIYYEKSK